MSPPIYLFLIHSQTLQHWYSEINTRMKDRKTNPCYVQEVREFKTEDRKNKVNQANKYK